VQADILIVDEALSVGDEAFQRKCFSRIEAIQKAGATVLFVSHSAMAVVELCSRAVLLDGGELLCSGHPKFVVSRYHKLLYAPPEKLEAIRQEIRGSNTAAGSAAQRQDPLAPRPEDGPLVRAHYDPHMKPLSTVSYESRGATIGQPRVTTLQGEAVNVLVHGEEYLYAYEVHFSQDSYNVRFGMLIKTVSGLEICGAVTSNPWRAIELVPAGAVARVQFRFRSLLNPAVYFMNAGVLGTVDGGEVYLHRHIDVLMIRIQPTEDFLATAIVNLSVIPEVAIDTPGGEVAVSL